MKEDDSNYKEEINSLFKETVDSLWVELKKLRDGESIDSPCQCIQLGLIFVDTLLHCCSLTPALSQDVTRIFQMIKDKLKEIEESITRPVKLRTLNLPEWTKKVAYQLKHMDQKKKNILSKQLWKSVSKIIA